MRWRGEELPTEETLNTALAALDGINPQEEVEAMLAIQMVGTYEVAMEMLTRAKQTDSVIALQSCGGLAVKLLRTYTAQVEALARLRRGGEQKVRVEHVHVHPGGQAIVGSVSAGEPRGGGARTKNGEQPYGAVDPGADASAPGSPVQSQDEERDILRSSSSEGKNALQAARGRSRKRGSKR